MNISGISSSAGIDQTSEGTSELEMLPQEVFHRVFQLAGQTSYENHRLIGSCRHLAQSGVTLTESIDNIFINHLISDIIKYLESHVLTAEDIDIYNPIIFDLEELIKANKDLHSENREKLAEKLVYTKQALICILKKLPFKRLIELQKLFQTTQDNLGSFSNLIKLAQIYHLAEVWFKSINPPVLDEDLRVMRELMIGLSGIKLSVNDIQNLIQMMEDTQKFTSSQITWFCTSVFD